MKDLVVYYSRTGKTEKAARRIAEKLGADLRELREKVSRKGFLGWLKAGFDARKGVQSELVNPDYSLSGYDRIVLCEPLWASSTVPALNTFLAHADFRGKQFHLVVVKGGSDASVLTGKQSAELKERGATVLSTLDVRAGMWKDAKLEAQMLEQVDAWAAGLSQPTTGLP